MKVPRKRKIQEIASNYLSYVEFEVFTKHGKDYNAEPCSFLVKKLQRTVRKSIKTEEEPVIK